MELFVLNQKSLKRCDGTVMLNDIVINLSKEDIKALIEIHRINGLGPAEYLEMSKKLSIIEARNEFLEREIKNYE